jgi:ankyrin repeat protein
MSALIYAAHHGDLAQVQELIAKHNDVNLADEVSRRLLHRYL